MFRSMPIIRELVLQLAKVTLKHSVKLWCYILCGDVAACHRAVCVCRVPCRMRLSFCTAHNTHTHTHIQIHNIFPMLHSWTPSMRIFLSLTVFPHVALSLILSALSQIARTPLWVSLTLTAYVSNWSCFSTWLIKSNFSSTPIVIHRFFTWIALGDVDLCVSCMLVRKAIILKETKWATWYITSGINP